MEPTGAGVGIAIQSLDSACSQLAFKNYRMMQPKQVLKQILLIALYSVLCMYTDYSGIYTYAN